MLMPAVYFVASDQYMSAFEQRSGDTRTRADLLDIAPLAYVQALNVVLTLVVVFGLRNDDGSVALKSRGMVRASGHLHNIGPVGGIPAPFQRIAILRVGYRAIATYGKSIRISY